MPETTAKIRKQLNAPELTLEDLTKFGNYVSGTKVTDAPEILFARLDINEIMPKGRRNPC